MFCHGTSEISACGQRLALHRFRIIHEEFDSDGREPCGGGAVCAVRERLGGEKESGAVNRETGDHMLAAVQMPKHLASKAAFKTRSRRLRRQRPALGRFEAPGLRHAIQ